MAARKKARDGEKGDGRVWAINAHDTVVEVSEDEFAQRYEPAGYRLMEDDEPAPPQQHEVERLPEGGRDLDPGFVPVAVQVNRKDTLRPDPPAAPGEAGGGAPEA